MEAGWRDNENGFQKPFGKNSISVLTQHILAVRAHAKSTSGGHLDLVHGFRKLIRRYRSCRNI
jgi:hypothetical protein